ncbi:hypothetical protein D3C76_1792430 [compost metagenome]
MVVLAVHVISNSPAHRNQLGAGSDRQHPTARHKGALDVLQQHPCFALKHTVVSVERNQMVEACRGPEHPIRI